MASGVRKTFGVQGNVSGSLDLDLDLALALALRNSRVSSRKGLEDGRIVGPKTLQRLLALFLCIAVAVFVSLILWRPICGWSALPGCSMGFTPADVVRSDNRQWELVAWFDYV